MTVYWVFVIKANTLPEILLTNTAVQTIPCSFFINTRISKGKPCRAPATASGGAAFQEAQRSTQKKQKRSFSMAF